MNDNSEAQDDELLALESIFGDGFCPFAPYNELEENQARGGELKIIIELNHPFYLSFTNNINGEIEKQIIRHLPPLHLYFTFPHNYPSEDPPEYTLSCKWINRSQLSYLCKRLDALWEENVGNEVMFTWAQCLKDETLDLLNINDTLFVSTNQIKRRKSSEIEKESSQNDEHCGGASGSRTNTEYDSKTPKFDPRTVQDVAPSTNLLRILREYDEEMRQKVFDLKFYNCKVCFLEKPGSSCMEFWPCNHVYCKECMKSYFEVQIREGNIKFLKCPEEKCDSEANPKQVEALVSNELYRKWDELLLSSTLSSLGDIQPCPRQHCQYPVTVEENQGQCPSCAFVFCGLCRFGWHGYEKCKLKNSEARKILEKYREGTEEEKRILEDRYGKKYLSVMVEEYLSSTYMENNAKDCPRCRSHIEKTDGCNKMTCKRCSANFCWLCEKFLDKMNPYSHFNNPNSGCFNMLFHGLAEDFIFDGVEEEDEEDEDDMIFG
ncbi:E3 ubiquitin-protein ligase RNF14 [Armadillidium nasatum]|uniref:RBR-type E3 ubiquitin transferase n=1 Tax=Armadillidium nasatum TaxID=96803 RepID=A0A5N5T8F4_9CRUS|nr:E3 ubiquitin-protein ligase RNF14 [Armadillidium nasatum]